MQFDALVSCYFLYILNSGAFNIAEGKQTLAKKKFYTSNDPFNILFYTSLLFL